MSAIRTVPAALGVAALAFALTGAPSGPVGAAQAQVGADGHPASALVGSPIDHVVIIYEENHSFDDILGELCQTRRTPCDGYTGPVKLADGIVAPNITEPDVVPSSGHGKVSQHDALANRWDAVLGCTRAPYKCVTHADPSNIPNISRLAETYAVSDASFAEFPTASYAAHVMLASGTLDGFISGENPEASKDGPPAGPGWGCDSDKDVQWRTGRYVPSCIPSPDGSGPYRASPVPYRPTIMQRVEAAGLTWHIYQGDSKTEPTDHVWSICPYFNWCLMNRFDLGHDSSTETFLEAAAGGGPLPNVSFLLPLPATSQHNLTSLAVGDNYIGRIMGAVENGPYWGSTAVFITWDDCGCFYDHVKPPPGMSLRNPMIIVSPWVKPGYTDSRTASQPYSMLAFVEHTFRLSNLSQSVTTAYDYAASFDFTQRPLAGVPMTRTAISPVERARLARLAPLISDDPT